MIAPKELLQWPLVRRLIPAVALLVAYLMAPGSGELTENAIYLVTEGHTAHAVDEAEHQSTNDEHGCTGIFHTCQCHTSVLFNLPTTISTVEYLPTTVLTYRMNIQGIRAEGHMRDLERPPRA